MTADEIEMTADELEEIRERLGYTQRVMAEYLGCDYTGYKRYATGTRAIPGYIKRSANLLDFIRENKLQKKLEAYLQR